MERIEIKSIGSLIDELCTTNLRCWHAQERLLEADRNGDVCSAADAAINAQKLNARRNQLIRAIDRRLGETDITQAEKTYG